MECGEYVVMLSNTGPGWSQVQTPDWPNNGQSLENNSDLGFGDAEEKEDGHGDMRNGATGSPHSVLLWLS